MPFEPNAMISASKIENENLDDVVPKTTAAPACWLDEHGDYLFRFASLRVQDVHVAEELVQETLVKGIQGFARFRGCLLYTSPSPRDQRGSRMPSSA